MGIVVPTTVSLSNESVGGGGEGSAENLMRSAAYSRSTSQTMAELTLGITVNGGLVTGSLQPGTSNSISISLAETGSSVELVVIAGAGPSRTVAARTGLTLVLPAPAPSDEGKKTCCKTARHDGSGFAIRANYRWHKSTGAWFMSDAHVSICDYNGRTQQFTDRFRSWTAAHNDVLRAFWAHEAAVCALNNARRTRDANAARANELREHLGECASRIAELERELEAVRAAHAEGEAALQGLAARRDADEAAVADAEAAVAVTAEAAVAAVTAN